MISIEDVTDAENEKQKPEAVRGAQAAETAEACDQQAAPAVESPQTDANAEGEAQVSGNSEEDTLVRGAWFELLGLLQTGADCILVGNTVF